MARTYNGQLLEIVKEWMEAEGADVANLDKASEWACKTGRYQRQPISMQKQCKREMAIAMRHAKHIDPQNRKVRSKHPIEIEYEGEQLTFWVDLRTAKPEQMELAFKKSWQAIGNDIKRHSIDHASYNDNNLYGAEIPLFDYNFNADAEEARLTGEYDDEGDGDYQDGDVEDPPNPPRAANAS
jgi:hypothetical protein